MAVIKQKYSADKVTRLQQFLINSKERDTPLEYKIMVDGLEAVRRTDDPEMFQGHEDLIDDDTKRIEIFIFIGHSQHCSRYIFSFTDDDGDVRKKQELNGIEVDEKITNAVQKERDIWEKDRIKEENKFLHERIQELVIENDELQTELNDLRSEQSPFTAIAGSLGASVIDNLLKNKAGVIGSFLSGITPETKSLPAKKEENEPEVNVNMVGNNNESGQPQQFSENELKYMGLIKTIHGACSREEFDQIMAILSRLITDKSTIETVLSLLDDTQNDTGEMPENS